MFLLSGGEATDPFEDVGHSPDAREQQAGYLIGEVAEPRTTKVEVSPTTGLIEKGLIFLFLSIEEDDALRT